MAKPVAALRDALRRAPGTAFADRHVLDNAAAPLIDLYWERLLRHCDKLARAVPEAGLEGEDLAIDAWKKTLRYLATPAGDRVNEGAHFGGLLWRTARTLFLDALEYHALHRMYRLEDPIAPGVSGTTLKDTQLDTRPTAEDLLLPSDSRYLRLVEQLFADEKQFARRYRQQHQRQPRNYKALVLYQLGLHWREVVGETRIEDREKAEWFRHYAALLGIPQADWERIEAAAMTAADARSDGCLPHLLAVANAICGTRLPGRGMLAVLRHEMNQFAAQAEGEGGV